MKGIILAGGTGTRLHPVTLATSKQLVPIYDKPMIYYPLSVLMLAEVRDVLIISTPEALPQFRAMLGDGARYGIRLSYAAQAAPRGVAEALLLGEGHLGGGPCALILGDNLFHGTNFSTTLREARTAMDGCVLFGYPVTDPENYGVAEVDAGGKLLSLEEKPRAPASRCAVTGLYLYDGRAPSIARSLRPSARGELEISDLNRVYLEEGRAELVELGRGFTWLDAGDHESLLAAGQYVQTLEKRQGVRIACIEEVALRMGYIGAEDCAALGARMANSAYGRYVMEVAAAAA